MGAWGTGLYQDDVADDIKHDYINKQKAGKSEEMALKEIFDENDAIFEDDDDKYGAWCALADTMWKYGRLTEEVKKKALEVIEQESTCIEERWQNRKDVLKRMKVLSNLREQLVSEQPMKKRIPIHKPYITKWKPKDVYQYKIAGMPKGYEEEEYEKYAGWYIIIFVEDIMEYEAAVPGVKDIVPLIYLKLSPHRLDNISQVNEIPTLIMGGYSKDTVVCKMKLLDSSERNYPKQLEYLGKCKDFVYPLNEDMTRTDPIWWFCLVSGVLISYEWNGHMYGQ